LSKRLGWGILGTGNIARQFAAGVMASGSGALIAVGSRDRASAQSFARSFGVSQCFDGYDPVLRSPQVDVIYVALPNSMHHVWTIAALGAGKHVLCEKPMASDTAQAEEMFDAADRAGRVLIEAFMYRSHPQTLAVLEAVRGGAIGDIRLIRTSFCFRTRKTEGNIRFNRELAGGSLMDIGCYCINFSRLIADAEPTHFDVSAQIHSSGVDEAAVGTMTFPGGILASFACGMTLQADNTAHICGSEGYIEIPIPWKPPAAEAIFTIAHSTPPRMDAAGPSAVTPPQPERRVISAGADLYAIETDDFAATVFDGRLPRVTRDDSIGNMRVLDAMRRKLGVM